MAQRLSGKATRRIAHTTQLDVICAWGYGDYKFDFVTRDHKHGWWNKASGDWGLYDDPTHSTTCEELFGADDAQGPPASPESTTHDDRLTE